jgi:threonine dehydrogenase-like Zn-dependent dehydrogenase
MPNKVAVYRNNSDIRVEERAMPAISAGEILVRVRASGICGSDVMRSEEHTAAGLCPDASAETASHVGNVPRRNDRIALHKPASDPAVPIRQCVPCSSGLDLQAHVH